MLQYPSQTRRSQQGPASLETLARLALATGSALCLLMLQTGCQSTDSNKHEAQESHFQDATQTKSPQTNAPSDALILREGDTIRVSFPGAPSLNTSALQIRRDGRVTLPLIGDFKAAGLTSSEMEKELIKLYGPQLQTKEVTVAVESSALSVYITGAVLRPGKIMSDHPMTALEAVMEAGGFDYTRANLKAVRVLRKENGQTQRYIINLKKVLQGDENDQFKLRPGDIMYVPERFAWF